MSNDKETITVNLKLTPEQIKIAQEFKDMMFKLVLFQEETMPDADNVVNLSTTSIVDDKLVVETITYNLRLSRAAEVKDE